MEAYIKAISYYLPEKVVTNDDLAKEFPEWDAEKIAKKIGIRQRHVAAQDETAGDMAVKVSKMLFKEYRISPEEIDFVLLCTQSPDYYLPTTACLVQERLDIPTHAGALDFNLGCSGYIYGLTLAKGLIYSGISKNILLITSETYSKFIHPKDKSNRSIFGDAATATLISENGFAKIGDFSLGTDGKGAENLIVKTGCSRNRVNKNDFSYDESGYVQSSDHLYMNGSEIFNFTLEAVPSLIQDVLKKNNLSKDDVDYFIFHQANEFMLNTLRKVCCIPKEKFYIDMEKTGNTVSSTVPIAIKEAISSSKIKPQDKVMLSGFGVGYSWGGNMLFF